MSTGDWLAGMSHPTQRECVTPYTGRYRHLRSSVTSSRQRLPVTSSFTLVTPRCFVRNVFKSNSAYVLHGESLDLKHRTLDLDDCKRSTLDNRDYKHELAAEENLLLHRSQNAQPCFRMRRATTAAATTPARKTVHTKRRPSSSPRRQQRASMLKPMLLGKSYNAPADDAVFLHIHAIPRPGSARDVTAVPDRREQLAKLQQLVDDSKHLPQPFRQYLAQLLHKPTQPDLKKLVRQHPLLAGASLSASSAVTQLQNYLSAKAAKLKTVSRFVQCQHPLSTAGMLL